MALEDTSLQIPAKKISRFVRKFLPEQSWKKITVATLPFETGSTTDAYSVQDIESDVKVIVKLNKNPTTLNGEDSQEENNNDDSEREVNLSCIVNTPTEEAIIAYMLSSKGWGPRLLGVTREGKVFEDFDGLLLTPETACDANVIREVATALARFHSLTPDMPLQKDKMFVLNRFLLEESSQPHNFAKVSKILKETLTDLDENVVKELTQFDLEKEVKWLLETYRDIPVKKAFIRFNNSFDHILIQDRRPSSTVSTPGTPSTGGSSSSRLCNRGIRNKVVIFTDNSHAMFAPRGIDLGGHFINRMINWSDPVNKINEEPYAPVDERGLFAREYLLELQQLLPESFNVDGMDNEGQILMEADLGALFYALYFFTWILSHESSWEKDPAIVTLLPFFHEFYTRYKLFCKKKYTHWP